MEELERWVEETARVTGPKRVQWCEWFRGRKPSTH